MRRSLLLALLPLAACAALKKADAPVTMRLAPPPPDPAAAALLPRTISVAPVASRGIAGGLRYTYVSAAEPAVLQQARTMFWEESPTHAAERSLVAALRTRFVGVIEPGLPGGADLRLIARLDRFEEIAAGAKAEALVAMSVTLTGPHPVAGSYCFSAAISSASPSDRAAAFDQALGAVAARAAQDAAAGTLSRSTC